MLSICRKMTVVFLLRLARFCANSVASRPESFGVDEPASGSMRQSCRPRETGGILTLIFRADGLPMLLRLLSANNSGHHDHTAASQARRRCDLRA
jgi:hypothetical protein